MKYKITLEITSARNIDLELDDVASPKTVTQLVKQLPFTVGLNLWGDEIYTDESPIEVGEENPQSLVELNDVAFWPAGKAVCLFFGPTPIGKKGEIKPYSPVNVIGKIINPDKEILSKVGGKLGTFKISK